MLAPGTLLAGRFRVEEVLEEHDGVCASRGHDRVLNRPVLLQTLPAQDSRTEAITSAARSAALLHDPRFLRVLDAAIDGDTAYVVREWVAGTNLAELLAGGPLESQAAVLLVREVARALSSAHTQGLHHLRLEPTAVIVAGDGSVKVSGLATDAAARERRSADPAASDARGLGRLLYAALTGRWPDGAGYGLPAAPLVDGRVATPRQVRAGIPRSLDEVTNRALAAGRAPHALSTPAAVAAALDRLAPPGGGRLPGGLTGLTGPAGRRRNDTPPALLPAAGDAGPRDAPAGTAAAVPPEPRRIPAEPARGARRGGLGRVLAVLAGGLLLVGAALFGLQLLLSALGPGGRPGDDATSAGPTPAAAPVAVSLVSAADYDPLGDGAENPDEAAAAIDADPATAWRTQTYYDPLEAQKAGVGLVVGLAEPVPVRMVRLSLAGPGHSLEIRVAPAGATAPPARPEEWASVGAVADAAETVEVALEEPATTRWVLVWLTALPASGSDWRGGVAGVEVLG